MEHEPWPIPTRGATYSASPSWSTVYFFSSLFRGIFETQGVRVPRAANSVTAFSPGDWSVEIRRGNGVDVIGRELAAVQVLMKNQTRKRETKRFQRASEKRGGEESRRKQREREREKEKNETFNDTCVRDTLAIMVNKVR